MSDNNYSTLPSEQRRNENSFESEDFEAKFNAIYADWQGAGVDQAVSHFLKQANQSRNTGNLHQAIYEGQVAYNFAIRRDERSLAMKASAVLGSILERAGKYRESEKLLLQSLEWFRQKQDVEQVLYVVINLAKVYLALNQYSIALQFSEEGLQLSQQLQDKRCLAVVLSNKGMIQKAMADYEQALESYRHALQLYEELDERYDIARVIGNIGTLFENMSRHEEAIQYLTRSMNEQREIGRFVDAAISEGNLGLTYQKTGDYAQAFYHLQNSLKAHRKSGKLDSLACVAGNLGRLYADVAEYGKALEYMEEAQKLFESIGRMDDVAIDLGNIGEVYLETGDLDKAEQYILRALEQFAKLNLKPGIATFSADLATIYERRGEYERAFHSNEQSSVIFTELGMRTQLARVLANQGRLFAQTRQYDKSLEYVNKALVIHTELDTKRDIAIDLCLLARVYAEKEFQRQDLKEAERYLRTSLEMSLEGDFKVNSSQCYFLLADIFRQQNCWQEADENFRKYHELHQLIQGVESKKRTEQFEHRRKLIEQEQRLAEERAADSARIASQQQLLNRVLPEAIATRLMNGEKVADYFPQISILFADIVGFTPIASRMHAKAVLAFLNYVFAEFDRIISKHSCEKIKTIGDGYLAVAGAPVECVDHAERLASAAIEMMKDLALPEEIQNTLPSGSRFQLRIGLHCGAAFGGVVGEERFIYDVYSDAVNVAARMESSGEPGRIHCSSDFAHHLMNRADRFKLEERGEITVKGKGQMISYFLIE